MNKEEFTRILKEYSFPDSIIEELWGSHVLGIELTEERVRDAAESVLPLLRLANRIEENLRDRSTNHA